MSLHPRRRSLGMPVLTVVWLTAVWVLLWGDLAVGTVLVGAGLAVLVTLALPLPAVEFTGHVHPLSLLYLAYRFVVDLVVASAQVAALALPPGRVARPAVVRVQLRSTSDLYLTFTAQLCSLVPGSVVVEAHRTTGMLYIHVLDLALAHGVHEARRHVLDTEARVLRALASPAELAAAGLTRNPRDTAEATG